jgi:hypothetical protein
LAKFEVSRSFLAHIANLNFANFIEKFFAQTNQNMVCDTYQCSHYTMILRCNWNNVLVGPKKTFGKEFVVKHICMPLLSFMLLLWLIQAKP